jgi:peroxiredoxin
MLTVGQSAPPFVLPGADPGDVDTHSLVEYTEAGWTVVVVFYPFDFHPVCTDQLCSLRDAGWLTTLSDVVVLGIGGDSVYAHREYARVNDIGFPLLSDSDGSVAADYGVRADDRDGHANVPDRAVVVVGPDRRVRYGWRADGEDDLPDLDAVRAVASRDAD